MEDKNLTSLVQSKKNGGSGNTGVVKLLGKSELPMEYISPGRSFLEALSRSTIWTNSHLNAIIMYWKQLNEFDVTNSQYPKGTMIDEKDQIIQLLNGMNALKGFNRSLAAMTYTGIYLPEGAGIKLSKEDRKALTQLQTMKMQQKDKDKEDEMA